ncbi:replicative DNA helicase [Sporosarcina sp. FSL W7-1283]|uniref:replicative DNA helicase n=1 Tax=Sporosarcina sp. FSL W7-1283 TaxID=2921560 RepID=UPI0030FB134B
MIQQYERPFTPLDETNGTTTGLAGLDLVLNGFQNSEFIVVAARPSMGKTDTLNHFALSAGWNGHLPIIFIDYLQIIRPDGNPANQTQAIGQISADLKNMAKEFSCPVVVLSQLSRAVEQRQDKRPLMSDLRDSGNSEQDADVVAFLYRADYYHKESIPADELEIDIAKHRNGPTGKVVVTYIKETGKLQDMGSMGRQRSGNG